jgi:tRNA1Val (adenine37-N6)-methyltransferase
MLNLDHQTLLEHVTQLLAKQGSFYCVLPAQSAELFCTFAQSLGLYCVNKLEVATKPQSQASRVLMEFSFKQTTQQIQHLTIYTGEGKYSADYVSLCRDYYLHF